MNILADGSLQSSTAVFTAGHEIEMKPLLFSCWRVVCCDPNRNRFSRVRELDLNHCSLDAREIHWHGFRPKNKTLVLLRDCTETPSASLRVVLLYRSAPSAFVFHINRIIAKSRKRQASYQFRPANPPGTSDLPGIARGASEISK